ncbi:hypothetical protein PMSD_18460 [Paenibacillus macquariensis subsp. defensor]|nr:hypothetical protein PMSD_18460 [Paenibacillus macquariensis subsp. defensor]
MYFYTLSSGCHEQYEEVTVIHETKFTKQQFGEMFNAAVEAEPLDPNEDSVSKYLIEHFGFKLMEPTIMIECEYGEYNKLTQRDYDSYNPVKMDAARARWRSKEIR